MSLHWTLLKMGLHPDESMSASMMKFKTEPNAVMSWKMYEKKKIISKLTKYPPINQCIAKF